MSSPRMQRAETLNYLIGYGLAAALTLVAFALVWLRLLPPFDTFYVVLGLAVAQALVHFRFFLHIDLRRNSRQDLQILLFSALIIALMVAGTLVVLFSLAARMM